MEKFLAGLEWADFFAPIAMAISLVLFLFDPLAMIQVCYYTWVIGIIAIELASSLVGHEGQKRNAIMDAILQTALFCGLPVAVLSLLANHVVAAAIAGGIWIGIFPIILILVLIDSNRKPTP